MMMETMIPIYVGDNNEEYKVQVIEPTKPSVNDPIDTLMACALFDDEYGNEIFRLTSRIAALLEIGWLTRAS